MENVLALYEEPYDPKRPVVCVDERPCQLIEDILMPVPMKPKETKEKPGAAKKEDYEYKKNGSANVFAHFEPLTGWRHFETTERRTSPDFAKQMKWLCDERYPEAEVIRVVVDNLTSHSIAAFYAAFPPEEAYRIASKIEFHYTPKHGSWLNMVEIELSALSRCCLKRRIGDVETLRREVAAYEAKRNKEVVKVEWQFRTKDARIKLKKLYPILS